MDYNWYVDECLRQLNDNKYYQKQTKDLTEEIQQRIKEYTSRMYSDKLIDEKTYKYLTSNPNSRAGRFYILPKIHKQGTLAVLLYQAMVTLLNASLNLLIIA